MKIFKAIAHLNIHFIYVIRNIFDICNQDFLAISFSLLSQKVNLDKFTQKKNEFIYSFLARGTVFR